MRKFIILLIILQSFITACSEKKTPESTQQENNNKTEDTLAKDAPAITTPSNPENRQDENERKWEEKMIPSISYQQKNNILYFTFQVKNDTQHPFIFHFKTGQQFDYIIKDTKGNVVQRYIPPKENKLFKVPTQYPVQPTGSIIYNIQIENLPKGTYTINCYLLATEVQPKTSLTFQVE